MSAQGRPQSSVGGGRRLSRAVGQTVLTGSVMISAVIEHMNWSGTAASLASDPGPAAPLLLPPSAVARSMVARLAIDRVRRPSTEQVATAAGQ